MSLRFTRLSRANLRMLKPGERITEHGIVAECRRDGDVAFAVNVMVDGRRIHRVLGTASAGVTRYQCEQFIEQVRTDARADRLALPKGRKLPLTFTQAAEKYLARLIENDGRNIRFKRGHLRVHLIPAFGTKRLTDLSDLDTERYKRARRSAGAAPATINREFSTLGHVFTVALKNGWIERIPFRPQKYAEQNGRITTLSEAELERLLQAAIAGPDSYLWLFIEIARATGMRHGEIVRIRWEHIDFEACRIFLPHAKAGARTQPTTQSLMVVLRRERDMRTDQTGWIFPARHGDSASGHLSNFARSFRKAVIAAGLNPKTVTPHALRHTAITRLVEAGIDLLTIMQISGHRSLRMIQRYAHVSAPHIDQAIAALDRKVV